jgi:hypothetical protein
MSEDNNVEDNRIAVQKYYPVLLTCPHGGTVKISPARKKSKLPSSCDPDQFTKDSDLFTLELSFLKIPGSNYMKTRLKQELELLYIIHGTSLLMSW